MTKTFYLCISIVFFACGPGVNSEPSTISDCTWIGVEDTTRLICGKLQVPENHGRPDGKQIEIAYVIMKSEDPDTDHYPMIHFTGGPGGQALTNIEGNLSNPILKTRDIIRFDQRGIGQSSALPDLTSRLYNLFPLDLKSSEERDFVRDIISDLRRNCDNEGIEIEMYNTFQNARDVGILMDHLGYEKYNLRGGSYGTRIARVVADMFPERIHTAIYDSPAPLSNDYLLSRLDDYSDALRKVLDFCQQDPECSAQYPYLERDYLQVLQDLDEDPLVAEYKGMPFYFNAGDMIFFLRYELYRNDSRERVPRFIRAVNTKDMDWINGVLDGRGMSSSNFAMFLACENYEEYDLSITEEVVSEKYSMLPLLPFELPLFTSLYLGSSEFLRSYATDEMKTLKLSDIPSIIFINQFDPVTPPENVDIFESKMSNVRSFIIDAGGHGGGDMACKRKIMDAFMTNPSEPIDPSCLDLYTE